MTMLEYTFQHIPGFGFVRDQQLSRDKIFTWEDYDKKYGAQMSFAFEKNFSKDVFAISRSNLINGNIAFFSNALPPSLQYRIPHSFPERTVFLDIETTGLSRYYDKITVVGWSIGSKYKYYIDGDIQGKNELLSDLTNAGCIITFNGSLFDIPFIKLAFQNIAIPPCHIDLRFLSKRVGLRGGQKVIETILKFKRPADFVEVDGLEATILWHKYKEGHIESLKRLIEYNTLDIEGMKFIFEKVTRSILKKEKSQIPISKVYQFSREKSSLIFTLDFPQKDKIYLPKYQGKIGPKIYFEDLPDLTQHRIVGIDLTGSEQKASGWALLQGNVSETKLIKSNSELIESTIALRPTIISIDSPLSLPEGRITVFDDDPGRKEFGITRLCERIMAKRGVKSYPCLIQSMQRLTQRGILLANEFRKMGYAVIESYPGAAQDILGIPRKKKSREYLIRGLQHFGIKGDYHLEGVSHDEIDAITSALVGTFYLANKYEALGNEVEDYLIIPEIKDEVSHNHSLVIGLSGQLSSGKTTCGKILQERGFAYARYSMVINQMLEKRGELVTRTNQQKLGQLIHIEKGQRWLGTQLVKMLPNNQKTVIDGIRFLEDHSFLREQFGVNFFHIHIEADEEKRRIRYSNIGHNDKRFEDASQHNVENEIYTLKDFADLVLSNNDSIADLESELKSIVDKLCR